MRPRKRIFSFNQSCLRQAPFLDRIVLNNVPNFLDMVGLSPPVNFGLYVSVNIMGQVFELLVHPLCDSFEKFFIYHDLIGVVE